ncbi:hypothetical protein DFS33DRAFT_1454779 [Desarmillaria ectypa]|nr:hypothetical protein DFS33DRAFT_1454779 [Desarmillaria ectypa]
MIKLRVCLSPLFLASPWPDCLKISQAAILLILAVATQNHPFDSFHHARLYFCFWLVFPLCFAVNIGTEGLPDTGLDTSDWVAGELPPLEETWSLNDMQIVAKNVIAKRHYGELFPSIYAIKSLEEIASVSLDGQVMFQQEYVWSNRSRLVDELKRFEDSGYKAILLTVDNTAIDGIR